MKFHEHLRATRQAVCPKLIEYRTTDPRVVDAVRLLDPAADEIERLSKIVTVLMRHADEMANALNTDAKRQSGKTNAVHGAAASYEITRLYIDRGEIPPA